MVLGEKHGTNYLPYTFLLCTHSFLICSVTELMMYMEVDFQFM